MVHTMRFMLPGCLINEQGELEGPINDVIISYDTVYVQGRSELATVAHVILTHIDMIRVLTSVRDDDITISPFVLSALLSSFDETVLAAWVATHIEISVHLLDSTPLCTSSWIIFKH